MSLRLRNNWKYIGEDRWDWEVFVEDDNSGELENINFVEYVLHPTFRSPRRITHNKEQNFKLRTNGWGTFWIKAFVNTKKGEKIPLRHLLVLKYDPPRGATQ